jgi:D-alanyl-D-alanine carboxypeptidase
MQKSLVALVSAFLVALTFHAGQARAESRLLIDAESGRVLEGENATFPWYPASVTKLMTTYVTLRAIREERITLDTVFAVGPNAAAQQPSKMGFKVGTQLTVDNTLKMMLVHSANDMAVVLAEGVSGSIAKFSDEMNANAQRLGMTQTHYVNPNGLPDDQQVTSARDLAILARALLHDFPDYDSYWHIGAIRLGKRVMRNTNRLLDAYPGADGMKTGFICASGFNLVGSASRGDKRLIAVVLGASSSAARTLRAAQMFERGFATNPLSWLIASRGTVDALLPVAVDPPNLRDEICGKARHKPAAEDEDDTAGNDVGGQNAFLLSSLHSANQKASDLLTSGLASAPIDVHVGPPNKWVSPATAMAAEPAKRKPAKPTAHAAVAAPNETDPAAGGSPTVKPRPAEVAKKPATTAKPSGEKAAGEKSTGEKPAGDKPKPKATAAPKPAGASDKPKSAASDQKPAIDGDKPKPKPVAAVKPKPAVQPAPTAAQ